MFESPPERRLFPGIVAVLLAIAAVFPRPRTRAAVVYLIALAAAFEMSLGFHGYMYRFLYEYVPVFAGLRVPARLGIFVIAFLAILAAQGYATLHDAVRPRLRRAFAVLISCVLLLEYSVSPLQLVPYENTRATGIRVPGAASAGSRGGVSGPSEECGSRPGRALHLHVHVPLEEARQRLQRILSALISPAARRLAIVS